MRFMFEPEFIKLIYSRRSILLIFSNYNSFLDDGGHQGDSTATFNDVLQDLDFGTGFWASHSLISSITFDKYNFYTISLCDSNGEGIIIIGTPKRDFQVTYNPYDLVNKKYNYRNYNLIRVLPEYFGGDRAGVAYGRLGGILYFQKDELYCLVMLELLPGKMIKNKFI